MWLVVCHSGLQNDFFFRQAGKSRRTQEIEIHNCILQIYKQNKLIFYMTSSFLKARYLLLLQSQSIGAGTFSFQYVLHILPCSLLILNIFFSFSFQLLFYLSINSPFHRSKHAFQSFFSFFFFPRQKEVVVLILFTAVKRRWNFNGFNKTFLLYSNVKLPFPHTVFCHVKFILY